MPLLPRAFPSSLILAGTLLATAAAAENRDTGLLFYLSANHGTTADFSAAGTPGPTFDSGVKIIPDGAQGPGLSCDDTQRLAWRAPGNIYAQRGTLAFSWRSRYPVGPTAFPVFRVAFADHSSWDMVWLRIDYNGHGFDAFVTDVSLARTRVSVDLPAFPAPSEWTHVALSWDETRGIRFYLNGKLAAVKETTAVYNTALDQFGPHSRIISPHNVQSDYNFVRGGDIDEIRIYDRMLDDPAIAALAREEAPAALPTLAARDLADPRFRDEWWLRYGWNRPGDPPPALPAKDVTVRKVEIHDAYDLKRWWWKANDGIPETTWPGVYNRSRLPGRNDYFQLPDWDCYSVSGKSITFVLPDEPWNQLEISGAAWGKMELLPPGTDNEAAGEAKAVKLLFERPAGQEKTVHFFRQEMTGGKIRFTNVEQETPIGELSAYHVTSGREPVGEEAVTLELSPPLRFHQPPPGFPEIESFIEDRNPADERSWMVALPYEPLARGAVDPKALPVVHVIVPDTWDGRSDGLDGIALDLPAMEFKATHGELIPFNIRVKDPLWPMRDMLDFSFSVKPGEAHTLWLDLRDRLLPPGKALYLTIASAAPGFGPSSLAGAEIRLRFKPRETACIEHEADRFTQVKDCYAMLVEEHPLSPKLNLWVRFETDLKDLLRVNPNHELAKQYAAIGMGAPNPPFVQPEPPAGVPLWAFRQVEALRRTARFVNWWIDHRQIANGEFGGGLSDDTDLTNLWPGVALMGCDPDKIAASLRAELDACYNNGMNTRGLPTIQADELHSYEEGANSLGQNLILNYGSPRQLERAMQTAGRYDWLTGVNAAGHRHIRSSYFNGLKMASEEPWGYAKAYSYLILQPGQLLVDFNGSPPTRRLLLELADGLLAHRRETGKGHFGLPSAINFETDHNGSATRGYLPWPLFWNAWQWTGRKDYLLPITDGGWPALSSVNADVLDQLDLRVSESPRILAAPAVPPPSAPEARRPDGRGSPHANPTRFYHAEQFRWQLTGDKSALAALYGEQIEEMALGEYINTEGSLWIDRVGVPTGELQRARLGGVALLRNATFPGHTVSWRFAAPATAESVAILIPDATLDGFKVIAYNLETTPVQAEMTGWNINPGEWEVTQGIDTNDDDKADAPVATRTVTLGRSQSISLSFAPRATTVLSFKLKTPGTPYWQRPDLGIDPQDVVVKGREIRVTVHGLGSVPSPVATLVWRDATGAVKASAEIPPLAAPVDLQPKTTEVILHLPAGVAASGGTVEIDPENRLGEITRLNNGVKL